MSNVLLVGTRKGLIVFERDGGDLKLTRDAFIGVQVTYAMVDPHSGTWWACLNHGHWGVKLHRSTNEGRDWEEVAAPAMPEGSKLKPGEPASVNYLWIMESAPPSGERLLIGTVPGGLFTSTDGGTSWQLCAPLWNHPTREHWFGGGFDQPGIHSILLDPANPQRMFVGVSCAAVFETLDGGETWMPRSKGLQATFLPDPTVEVGHDPHRLVACAADRQVMWQQNHCGIFRTTDGGLNWQMVSAADATPHFGFAIECDAVDPLTAWVVPAVADEQRVAIDRALVVYRTRDGGTTWQEFREGLPQRDCYDFAFRHGLAASGESLALGTSGGSLYTSDDAGESWRVAAKDLAPVYSVRWA